MEVGFRSEGERVQKRENRESGLVTRLMISMILGHSRKLATL